MKKLFSLWLAALLVFGLFCGCASQVQTQTEPAQPEEETLPHQESEAPQASDAQNAEQEAAAQAQRTEKVSHVVVIDPGHQDSGNFAEEPNGPGSSTMKAKVSSGTQGQFTALAEYELNLQVALQLEEELLSRGYTVYMTRRTNDVDISNAERAQYASEVGGEILVRIHANGSEDASVSGALTICQTPDNPYQDLYEQSRLLSDCILETYCPLTGIADRGVWETDTMTGINWCEVPSTIVEMGYMTNESDDNNMADPEFQIKIVQGIADGIDLYFSRSQAEETTQ